MSPHHATARERPTVSVVIPVKDDAVALRRCLRALSLQLDPPDEVVVVDNASTDDSAGVARAAGARIVTCPQPGIPAAAAAGYDSARCDLILRLDADCIPAITWVGDLRSDFARRPGVAVLTGGARFVDGSRALRTPLAAVYLGCYAAFGYLALGHLPLFGSNLAFRRSSWRRVSSRVHREDPRLHDDFDLAFHLGEYDVIRHTAAPMGMSMRPFDDPRAFIRRVAGGFRSVVSHWPVDLPPIRLVRRWLRHARRRRRASTRTGDEA
ncbi:glycosyltransferase family A protein [Microbacterium oleivorans]|uniref:4,4'-diaponeurosporenoate glycosyltransferase n=1 Tax=Microbacterium oleivorans TaxID=273677 RepID=A0A7D5IPT5_9MICO|nr:glycosyltransferase family A protein [Microbacterium oleivorans]QLD11121.1 glycosyltransferase family 2 protein [Microbacterium oleivorans]